MSKSFDLTGKVAIVTGGGRGIGRAIARRFAEAGCKVAIASRKMENLEATANELASLPGKVIPIQCHVGHMSEIENLVATTQRELGPVDILVNNSATNVGQGPALKVEDSMLDKMIEINIKSALRLIRLTAPGMLERKSGSIINIASIAGLKPQVGGLLYSFTKAGLIMMTRNWAQEFGPSNVRVNAIAPGLIKTDFSEFLWSNDAIRGRIEMGQPIRRIGDPEEIGGLALFLASDESSYVTGETIVVDGGSMAAGW